MNTITAARASEQAKLDVKTMIRDSTCMPDRDYYGKIGRSSGSTACHLISRVSGQHFYSG